MVRSLQAFFKHDMASSALLVIALILAMIFANSPLKGAYDAFLHLPILVQIGHTAAIDKPLLLWINDGFMAIFFLLVGLELKRELIHGDLARKEQIILPAAAAIGGMVVPALCYVALNYQNAEALKGWAIPAATDIAFALGVLAALKSRIPASLKVFLLALAILDDLGAIIIIALFYTSQLSLVALGLAVMLFGLLLLFNHWHITRLTPYMVVGTLLWLCVLKSGIHATVAGVLLALTIPLKGRRKGKTASPLYNLEVRLHNSVTYAILPLFAFANSGITLNTQQLAHALNPIPLGVMVGLFVGKQIGVFAFVLATVKLGLARLPAGANWRHMYGVALLCGIGFTMSLFIGSLAFEDSPYMAVERIGIIAGSLLSALCGYCVLRFASHKTG